MATKKKKTQKTRAVRRVSRKQNLQYWIVALFAVVVALLLVSSDGVSADAMKGLGKCVQTGEKTVNIKVVDKKGKAASGKLYEFGVSKYYQYTTTGWSKKITLKGKTLRESTLASTYNIEHRTDDAGNSSFKVPICAIETSKGKKYFMGVNDYIFNEYSINADETKEKRVRISYGGKVGDSDLSRLKSNLKLKLSTLWTCSGTTCSAGNPWVTGEVVVIKDNPTRLTYRIVDKKTKINAKITAGVSLEGKTCTSGGCSSYTSYNMSYFLEPSADGFYYDNFYIARYTDSKGKKQYFVSKNIDGKTVIIKKVTIKDPKNQALRTISPGFPIATAEAKALAFQFNKGKALAFTTK